MLEGPKIGISRSYRLNPEFGWKGSARNHVIALDQERKKRMANAGIKGVIEGGQQARRKPQSATRTRWTCSPVNPREAPTGCLRSNPRSEARAHRKLRLSCSDLKPGYTKGPPCASLGRFLCDLVQGVPPRNPKPQKQKSKASASGGPPGAFATWQAAGEEHPQPPARSVRVVPGRQGQAAARVAARALTPIPSDSAPQAPARASGAFSVKGGSRGWCGPQPRRGEDTAP